MRELLFLLLLLACPLMMLMMHGRHGHGSHDHGAGDDGASTQDLRRRRDELDRLIDERESAPGMHVHKGTWFAAREPVALDGSTMRTERR